MASAAADASRRSITKLIHKVQTLLGFKIQIIVYNIVNRRNADSGSCPSKFKISFSESKPRGPNNLDETHASLLAIYIAHFCIYQIAILCTIALYTTRVVQTGI